MAKLHLIVNSSRSYGAYLRDEKFKEWGTTEDPRAVNTIAQANMTTMFGTSGPAKIELKDKAALDKLLKELEGFDSAKLKQPLVILTAVPIPSTKRLQTKIIEFGGTVDAKNKADQKNVGTDLFAGLKISREVKDFLIDWAGQEPESLLGVVRFIRNLSPEKQPRVSIDMVLMQLVQESGELSPFDLEGPVLKGNIGEALAVARRVPLAPAATVLFNKLQVLYKAAKIMEIEPSISSEDLSDCLNLVGRSVNFIRPTAKRIGADKLEKMVAIALDFDTLRKSGIPGIQSRFEVSIYKLCEAVR